MRFPCVYGFLCFTVLKLKLSFNENITTFVECTLYFSANLFNDRLNITTGVTANVVNMTTRALNGGSLGSLSAYIVQWSAHLSSLLTCNLKSALRYLFASESCCLVYSSQWEVTALAAFRVLTMSSSESNACTPSVVI